MKLPIILVAIAIIMGLGVFIGYEIWHIIPSIDSKADYYKAKNFKTDTIRDTITRWSHINEPGILVPFPFTKPGKPLPPKVVVIRDTQYIHHPADTIYKNIPTPQRYESYDHLVYGEISKDSLRLDLQRGNLPVQTKLYLTNYSKYKYQILNNSINITELKTRKLDYVAPSKKLITYNGTYLNAVDQISDKVYLVELSTGFNIGKIRILGFGNIPVNQNKNVVAYGVRVGFRLF